MNTIDRIIKYIKYKGISKNEFCKQNHLNHSFFHSTGNLTISTINEIIKNHPDLNLEWLIIGKGEMIKKVSAEAEQIKEIQEKLKLYEDLISSLKETNELLKKQLAECERNQKNSAHFSKTSAELKK
ncbi:MAG: hypothetical protein OHK0036_11480 [Bacteroidia bacterium]